MIMRYRGALAALALVGFGACSGEDRSSNLGSSFVAEAQAPPAAAVCTASGSSTELPAEVKESSGLVQSRRDPQLFWTHNDAGNAPVIFAVSSDGRMRSQVRVSGARLEDWEDIDAGPCGGADCLFIGDIGDNDATRNAITVYQVEEPRAGATTSANAIARSARYPSGPRDAEAMYVLSGTVYLVTKGRTGAIELYRWPQGQGTVQLERIRELFGKPRNKDDLVTSASASPDGKWVAVRTYRTLYIYKAAELTAPGNPVPLKADLSATGEKQGEGLAILNDGTVWLSSEAGGKKGSPALTRLSCTLPG